MVPVTHHILVSISPSSLHGVDKFMSILMKPSRECSNRSLIVLPHGGPHSALLDSFNLQVCGFVQLGFTVLIVNYRGSVGQGQSSIESLLGHIGINDVEDVVEAVAQCLRTNSDLDPHKVFGFGGSHGGFIIAHLMGQCPSLLAGAVIRNAAFDVVPKVGVSDIPDWNFVEALGRKDFLWSRNICLTPEEIDGMCDASPVKYLDVMKTPTLLLVGAYDRRISPTQSIRFFKQLRHRGVECDLKVFPQDSHSLSSVETEAQVFLLAHRWFTSHFPKV